MCVLRKNCLLSHLMCFLGVRHGRGVYAHTGGVLSLSSIATERFVSVGADGLAKVRSHNPHVSVLVFSDCFQCSSGPMIASYPRKLHRAGSATCCELVMPSALLGLRKCPLWLLLCRTHRQWYVTALTVPLWVDIIDCLFMQLCDITTGAIIASLTSHNARITSLSCDGPLLCSSGSPFLSFFFVSY